MLFNIEGAKVQQFGLRVRTLRPVEHGKVVETTRYLGMAGPLSPLPKHKAPFRKGSGFLELAFAVKLLHECIEAICFLHCCIGAQSRSRACTAMLSAAEGNACRNHEDCQNPGLLSHRPCSSRLRRCGSSGVQSPAGMNAAQ